MTESPAVADAGPLIHLDEVRLSSALALFPTVFVPHAVAAEIQMRAGGPGNHALRRCKVERPSKAARQPIGSLSLADVAALELARKRDALLLTDDLDLRDTAHLAGIDVVGTIGIIVRAARTGVVAGTTARDALDALLSESTLFITPNLIRQAQAALNL